MITEPDILSTSPTETFVQADCETWYATLLDDAHPTNINGMSNKKTYFLFDIKRNFCHIGTPNYADLVNSLRHTKKA